MNSKNHSRGISLVGFLGASVVLIGLVLLCFRVVPTYIENYSVKDSLRSLQSKVDRQESGAVSKLSIRKSLNKMFDVNQITVIKPTEVKITRTGKGFNVRAEYDVEVSLVGNISLLIRFDDNVAVTEHVPSS